MDYSILEKSTLFQGVEANVLRGYLEETPHHIQCYDKEETIFHLMDPALRIGIILEGRVEAQKSFPNGSQVNVSVRGPGEMIGPAAVFSKSQRYPCDIVALEPATLMMLRKEDLLSLMQKDVKILQNFTTEIASATYMLQQRLELLSYSGIAQKAAFWLLMQVRQTGKSLVQIPDSMSRWAMIMNVSRPSLHREMKKLEEEGIIRYEGKNIYVLDPDGLQAVLSE
ncbi:MAG: Crp/Fnr family transcriptional regulator [Oscillospiraceae bacterium]|nr:Crp/Fnr family transcriptional regulator [Oscillospiraceae bacterium]